MARGHSRDEEQHEVDTALRLSPSTSFRNSSIAAMSFKWLSLPAFSRLPSLSLPALTTLHLPVEPIHRIGHFIAPLPA